MVDLSPSFELKYQPIDNDHRRLAEIITDIVKAIDEGRSDECDQLVPYFVKTAKQHFLHEEAELEKIGYPHLEKHHAHHATLIEKLETMQELARNVGNSELARETLRKELVFFLMDDVINADLDFKDYLEAKGLSEKT